VVIYAVILLLSIALALFMSQRLSRPIRELAEGANVVAGGDWDYRLEVEAGGEVGRLVEAFNGMVARLDDQRRRLVDMERIATWREMARHLAHEIKNPLLPIRLTIQELKDQYQGDDTRYREILVESTRVVGDELDHLKNLVKEFSSFARMPDISPREASLDDLVRDVAKLYPQVSVAIDSQTEFPAFAFDPDQMRSVLVNLFDNAVIAMAGQGSIGIAITQRGRDAAIEFADNGPGIPGDEIDRIFDPYFTTREEGTGLGLAMVKNVILLHGGTIRVRSAVGKGTIFTITLPLDGSDSIHKEL
jgi:two-component system nitrogen regulation sensor histidine kinase NtrY